MFEETLDKELVKKAKETAELNKENWQEEYNRIERNESGFF